MGPSIWGEPWGTTCPLLALGVDTAPHGNTTLLILVAKIDLTNPNSVTQLSSKFSPPW